MDELGGDVDRVVPELGSVETALAGIGTIEQLRERARTMLVAALVFRDNRVGHQYAGMIKQAQECMERRYMEPELSLNDVAAQVNLSRVPFQRRVQPGDRPDVQGVPDRDPDQEGQGAVADDDADAPPRSATGSGTTTRTISATSSISTRA